MDDSALLIAGVGGLGCSWATRAHKNCLNYADLVLIDAEKNSLLEESSAHILQLGSGENLAGCAALPPLGKERMRSMAPLVSDLMRPVEMVVILAGLGGGTGSGAAPEFARLARQKGALVISIAALPFETQMVRKRLAEKALEDLRAYSDVCVQVSLDRLAWQARERGLDWTKRTGWIEELTIGLIQTLARVGKINLDLMDLRAILSRDGQATMLVAESGLGDPSNVFQSAIDAPLFDMEFAGAKGCLLQVEGGPDMTIEQLDEVASAFTSGLHTDAQVILGARVGDELEGRMRVVAVLSGMSN